MSFRGRWGDKLKKSSIPKLEPLHAKAAEKCSNMLSVESKTCQNSYKQAPVGGRTCSSFLVFGPGAKRPQSDAKRREAIARHRWVFFHSATVVELFV